MAGLQTVMYSLCAQLYPVSIKALGVGMASGIGRVGAIVASFIGLALVATGSTFFLVIAAASVAAAWPCWSSGTTRRRLPKAPCTDLPGVY